MNQDFPLALSYDDVLLVPQYSTIESRSDIDLSVQLSPRIKLKLPITSSPMSDVTNAEFAIALGKLGGLGYLPRFNSINEEVNMVKKVKSAQVYCAASIGLRESFVERSQALVEAGVNALLIDVADAHMQKAIDATKSLKEKFGKKIDIHSGLVSTGDGAKRLFESGADCVHIGIGAGSICTTRIMTGVGVPNITTILDCSIASKKYKKTLVIDAGCKNSGDIVKALAAGSHAVRCGFLLAGLDDSPGTLIKKSGKYYKKYNGSTSLAEKKEHVKKGLFSGIKYIRHVEGVESLVPYRGNTENYIKNIEAGVRSGFSYCGAKTINDLQNKAKFIRITEMGKRESGAHDVILTQNS